MKNAFCKMCVTVCGTFVPDEGVVAGYDNRIRDKSPAKWGVQIAGMILGARSSIKTTVGKRIELLSVADCQSFSGCGFLFAKIMFFIGRAAVAGHQKYSLLLLFHQLLDFCENAVHLITFQKSGKLFFLNVQPHIFQSFFYINVTFHCGQLLA